MWKRLEPLRVRWIRRASYAGAAVLVLVGTLLFEGEMCSTSTTSPVYCGLVPIALYWAAGAAAVILSVWAAVSFWRETPGGDL
jgi:hypothetical protein